jgi:hypothetical protein
VYLETSRSAPDWCPRVTDSGENFGVQALNVNDFDDEVTVFGGPDQVELKTYSDSEDVEPRQPRVAGCSTPMPRPGAAPATRPGPCRRRATWDD